MRNNNRNQSTNESIPNVSIVLPTFNDLKHLPKAVESVLAQTFTDFELIIVNDGSTDGTCEYLDSLTDPRIRTIHQQNLRLPTALNTGFGIARGELLTWVSSDNYCAPNFLETFVAALEANPEAGFAYSAFAWIDSRGQGSGVGGQVTKDQNLAYHNILAANPGLASFMYRRVCMETVGLYDTEIEGAEDWDMWLRIVERFDTVYVPDVLYYYRAHEQSMTSRQSEQIRNACRRTFEKALARKNDNVDLADLYPSIPLCKDQRLAEFHACFDFGTRLLRSPFDAADEACSFIEAAVSIDLGNREQGTGNSVRESEVVGAASNLAAAYAMSGRWKDATDIVDQLQQIDNPQVKQICDIIKGRDALRLSSAPLFTLDKESSELLQIEETQRAGRFRIPKQVHFLMNDKCNAKCIMCGGDYYRSTSGRSITLGKFKKMARNLKLGEVGAVCLAGAGDPLLNPDLISIIKFINKEYPSVDVSITTNGIALTKELSKQLLDCRLSLINISINSTTRETFKRIMQVDEFDTVCENMRQFTELREQGTGNREQREDDRIAVRLSSAISRLNIEELPTMVELGHDLGVDAVNVMYCRFYPESIRHLNVEREEDRLENSESLFYHQKLSDEMVEKAESLAAQYGITFTHEPLFKENAEPNKCTWPYNEIMVGFDGEIYPCGGAEVHFKEKVESGEYNFGNALNQTIDEFWNSELYRSLRASASHCGECSIPECDCCANTIRPNDVRMHIMEWGPGVRGQGSDSGPRPPTPDPLVSVIVPTYNRPEQLVDTIESILAQTYPNIEIIVVNDAGPDVESVVMGLNAKGNIRYLAHEKNQGLAATRNTGIKAARGKYIAYLDDDDIYYPNHIETLVNYLEMHDCKVAYTDAYRAHQTEENGKYVVTHRDVPYSEDFDKDRILVGNFIPVLCFMHEKSCIDEVGLFDETLRAHEDWDLWIRMSRVFEFMHIKEITCEFTWREDGSTMTSESQVEYLRSIEAIYSKYRDYTEGKPGVVEQQQHYVQSRQQVVRKELEGRPDADKSLPPNHEMIVCPFCEGADAEPYRLSADIVKCSRCNTVYLRTRMTKAAMEQLYQRYADGASHMALPDSQEEVKRNGLRRDYWLKEILEFAKPEGALLDVGCGWGAFLDNARDAGFTPRGIELTRKCVEFANSELGIHVTSDQLMDTPLMERSLSVVTANHVLEHLPEPRHALEKIYAALKPDGVFCGIVPNIESLCSQILQEKWEWIDPHCHYVHYSPDVLKAHLESAGFVVERIYTAGGDYRTSVIEEVARRVFSPASEEDLKGMLKKVNEKGRGEEIRFIARKPASEHKKINPKHKVQPPAVGNRTTSTVRSSAWDGSFKPDASIIIPVYNNIGYTLKCLKSLDQNTEGPAYEIIVIDNASVDATAEELEKAAKKYPNMQVLTNSTNLGFATACNIGAKAARGQYLVFLNNDTEVEPGWLSTGIERLASSEDIGIVGAKLLYPDRTVQHCGIVFVKDFERYTAKPWPLHRLMGVQENDFRVNEPGDAQAVTGACLFIEGDLFESVGGFEEAYGMYFEDTDLCFKVRRAGKRVFYEPKCVVIHHEGKSSPNQAVIDKLNTKAGEIFYSRWAQEVRAIEMESFIERRDGKYVYLREEILPGQYNADTLAYLIELLKQLPVHYTHFGGAGDALLFMSTFYDDNPNATVVSMANSTAAMRSFFDAFPKLERVYFIPYNKNRPVWHNALRRLSRTMDNCLGAGTTPKASYEDEWADSIDIFKEYGVNPRPQWARAFGTERIEDIQVVLAPKGSAEGMLRSKRNIIPPRLWNPILRLLEANKIRPIIVGTPDESMAYPADRNCIDRRSYCFSEQMRLIASSDILIGADSWAKTLSALVGVPTIVFESVKGEDLRDWQDASENVFLRPWKDITIVADIEEFLNVFTRHYKRKLGNSTGLAAPEDYRNYRTPSRKHEAVTTSLSRAFWERNYPDIENVLVRCGGSIEDTLAATAVVSELKRQYNHLNIFVSGDETVEAVFRHHPDVAGYVKKNSNEEIGIEGGCGTTVELNHIIGKLPERYLGMNALDLWGNIAGVKLQSRSIIYAFEPEESAWAEDEIKKFDGKGLKIGMHFGGVTDPRRYYQYGSEVMAKILDLNSDAEIIVLGEESPRYTHPRVHDCPLRQIDLRKQIALAARCDVFVVTDGSFLKIAQEICRKPTVGIFGPTDPMRCASTGTDLVPVRNASLDCLACHWQPPCGIECMAGLEPDTIVSALTSVIEAVRDGKPVPGTIRCGNELDRVDFELGMEPDYTLSIMRGLKNQGRAVELVLIDPGKVLPTYADQWNGLSLKSIVKHPAPEEEPIRIAWEGSQFVHHSFAQTNRELCLGLIESGHELSIIPYEQNQFGPEADPRFADLARRVRARLSGPVDIHVRHQWPPKFSPPPEGRWVMFQPWEFGSLPKKWAEVMRAQVDEVWVPTSFVRDGYIKSGVPAEKVFVVPNGLDEKLFNPSAPAADLGICLKTPYSPPYEGGQMISPLPNKEGLGEVPTFKFLFVGGTVWRKGIDVLLAAYEKAFNKTDNVCLVIKDVGGSTVYKGQTAYGKIQQMQENPNTPPILYTDRDMSPNEVPGLYTACGCLVHPYRGEGFGMPIAEAMACGLPVIVTNYGAALDFCNEDTAYLIPAKEVRFDERRVDNLETVDYPWIAEPNVDSLADLMRHVYENQKEAQQKGSAASKHILANFTWDCTAVAVESRLVALKNTADSVIEGDVRELGLRAYKEGRWSEAIRCLNQQVKAGPTDSEMMNALALAYESSGDGKRARSILGEAIKADPNCAESHRNLAHLLAKQGRMLEAADSACRAVELDSSDNRSIKILEETRALVRNLKPAARKKGKKHKTPQGPTAEEINARLKRINSLIARVEVSESSDKPRISLCMIVRNEEDYLDDCLSSVKGLVDEIVIVDTGSTDRTIEIAKTHGAQVHCREWTDSYAEAKNSAIEQATGEWILILDADECLDPASKDVILRSVQKQAADGYELLFNNYRSDGINPDIFTHRTCRLFQNKPDYRYTGRVHEQIVPSITASGGKVSRLDAVVHHYGYKPDVIDHKNKHEKYIRLLKADLEGNPDDIQCLYNLGVTYRSCGQPKEALVYLEKAAELVKTTHEYAPLVFTSLSYAHYTLGDAGQALETVERAEKVGLIHPELYFCKGNSLLLLTRYREAISQFVEALRTGMSRAWIGEAGTWGYKALYGIATAYMALGEYRDAIETCEKAILKKPDDVSSLQLLSRASFQLGKYDETESYLKEVIKLRPSQTEPVIALGDFYYGQGRYSDATAQYTGLLDAGLDTPDIRYRLGLSALAANNLDMAENNFVKAMQLDEDYPQGYTGLGQVRAAQGRTGDALACFVRALEADPTYSDAYFSAGDLLSSIGKYEEAVNIYQNGLAFRPDNAVGFVALGDCYLAMNAPDAAALAYRQALNIRPDYDEAKERLDEVEGVSSLKLAA